MIRINLLPTRDAPRRQAAMVQLAVFGVILVAAAAVIFTLDTIQRDRVASQRRANSVIENRIERIRRQIQDHDEIRARIEEIESKQVVIDQLIAGRTGPTFVLIELAKVLSRNGSPSIDHDRYMDIVRRSPGQAYDPNWDGRRLWLGSFVEENREVTLHGDALSHEDVAELLRRLTLSDYFYDVTLVTTQMAHDAGSSGPTMAAGIISFEIRCRLRYGGLSSTTEEGAAQPADQAAAATGA